MLSDNYIVTTFIINIFFVQEDFLKWDNKNKRFTQEVNRFPEWMINNARNCLKEIQNFHEKYFEKLQDGRYNNNLRENIFFDFNEGEYSFLDGYYKPIKEYFEYDKNSEDYHYKYVYSNGAYLLIKNKNHMSPKFQDNYYILESHYDDYIKDLNNVVSRILFNNN